MREELSALGSTTDEYLLTGHAPLPRQKTVPSFSNALGRLVFRPS